MRLSTWLGVAMSLLALGCTGFAATNTTFSANVYHGFPKCSQPCADLALQASGCEKDSGSCACRAMLSKPMVECLRRDCLMKDILRTVNSTALACDLPPRTRPRGLMTITCIVLGSVSLVCIVLRMMSRPPLPTRWTEMMDDWVLVANGFIIAGFTAISVLLNIWGFGRDLYTLSFHQITLSQKFLYAHEITYTVSVMLTRISILCFYLRVFPFVVLPALKRVIYVAMVVAVATGIGFSLGFALQCTPVWYNWDWWKNVAHGHCISLNALGWSYGAVNIALDVWIMAIPLPEIHKLRLRSKQRFGVALVFVAWAVVIIVSIPRLVYLRDFYESNNQTWHVYDATFWAAIEAYTTVICACLPRIYMLFSKMYRKRFPRPDTEQGRTGRERMRSGSICRLPPVVDLATPRSSFVRMSSLTKGGVRR